MSGFDLKLHNAEAGMDAEVVRLSKDAGLPMYVVTLKPMDVINNSGVGQFDPAPLVRELRV